MAFDSLSKKACCIFIFPIEKQLNPLSGGFKAAVAIAQVFDWQILLYHFWERTVILLNPHLKLSDIFKYSNLVVTDVIQYI